MNTATYSKAPDAIARGEVRWLPRFTAAAVWGVWALMLAAALMYVATYGRNIPFMDDWEMVPAVTGEQPVTATWLWSQHNEHRLPLPRLILLSLAWLSGGDWRAGMVYSVLALGLLSATLIRTCAKVRGRPSLSDAFFPLVLLHWGHTDNLLWNWQVGFVTATVISGLVLCVILCSPGPGRWQVAATLAALVALPLCGANGLLYTPPLLVWLAVSGPRRHWGRPILALVPLAVLSLYFLGLEPAVMPARPDLGGVLRTAAEFIATALGSPAALQPAWPLGMVAILSVELTAAYMAWRAIRHQPGEQSRALGLLLFLAGGFSVALAIGWGRSGLGPDSGLARRYVTLSALSLCAAYGALAIYGQYVAGHILPVVLAFAAAIMLYPNGIEGCARGATQRARADRFFEDVQSGLPPLALVDRYTRFPMALYPRAHRAPMAAWLVMLKRARMGCFADLRNDPVYRVEALPREEIANSGNICSLGAPRRVYGVRVGYRYRPVAPLAEFTFSWRAEHSPSADVSHFEQAVLQTPEGDSVLIWIDGPLAEFTIVLDDKPSLGNVTSVELLVPFQGWRRTTWRN